MNWATGIDGRIPQRNTRVSDQPVPLSPLHRASLKPPPELLLFHSRNPLQIRLQQRHLTPLTPWLEGRRRRHRRIPVERANILTNVASINLPADSLAEFLRNLSPQ